MLATVRRRGQWRERPGGGKGSQTPPSLSQREPPGLILYTPRKTVPQ